MSRVLSSPPFVGMARTYWRCDRARCRRRFSARRFFIYPKNRVSMGRAQGQAAGEMDVGSLGGIPHRRAWPRSRHTRRIGARRQWQDPLHCAPKTIANLGAYMSNLLVVGADLSLCHAAVGQYDTSRQIIARSTCLIHTTRRFDAYRGRRAAGGDLVVERLIWKYQARQMQIDRRICAGVTSSTNFRIRRQ